MRELSISEALKVLNLSESNKYDEIYFEGPF